MCETRSPKRLTDVELDAIEDGLGELRRTLQAGEFFEAERIMRRPTLDAFTVSHLISELRRLRTLVKDAASYFDTVDRAVGPEQERRIRQLQVRLKAEADRE